MKNQRQPRIRCDVRQKLFQFQPHQVAVITHLNNRNSPLAYALCKHTHTLTLTLLPIKLFMVAQNVSDLFNPLSSSSSHHHRYHRPSLSYGQTRRLSLSLAFARLLEISRWARTAWKRNAWNVAKKNWRRTIGFCPTNIHSIDTNNRWTSMSDYIIYDEFMCVRFFLLWHSFQRLHVYWFIFNEVESRWWNKMNHRWWTGPVAWTSEPQIHENFRWFNWLCCAIWYHPNDFFCTSFLLSSLRYLIYFRGLSNHFYVFQLERKEKNSSVQWWLQLTMK